MIWTQTIGLAWFLFILGWATWQIGWRGGKRENGRDSRDDAGGATPMW